MNPYITYVKRKRRGAVILCGGEGRRMGRDKASLAFDSETLLSRIVRLAGEVVLPTNIVVVAAPGQQLPDLPAEVRIVRDAQKGMGPLPALIAGLGATPACVESALAVPCDAPLFNRPFFEYLFAHCDKAGRDASTTAGDALVPVDGERLYPLAAIYLRHCAEKLQLAYDRGERSLHGALRSWEVDLRTISVEEMRRWDPELDSLINCNQPQEYEQALARAAIQSEGRSDL